MQKSKLAVIVLLLLAVAACAESKNSLDLGIAGVDARSMGLGRSQTALADDASAIFENPGGLGLIKSWGATSMSTRILRRVDYQMLGGVLPTSAGTFGLGYIGMTSPAGFKTTDRASLATATPINYGSSYLFLSYGYELSRNINNSNMGKIGIGGSLKYINNKFGNVDNASGNGLELDLGLLMKPNSQVTLGLTWLNAWMGDSVRWDSKTSEDVPSSFRLGATFVPRPGLLLAIDAETSTTKQPLLMHAGVEWMPHPIFTLRAGVDQDPSGPTTAATNLTAGLGINVSGFHFDYAYRADALQSFNSNHYLSISFMPANPKVAASANIAPTMVKEEKVAGVVAEVAPEVAPAENPKVETVKKVRSYDEIMAAYKASLKK